MSVNPGWYKDPQGHDRLRYWDGTSWTEHFSDGPPTDQTAQFGAASPYPTQQTGQGPTVAPFTNFPDPGPVSPNGGGFTGWMSRHKILTGVIAAVLFFTVVGALIGDDDKEIQATETSAGSTEEQSQDTSPETEAEPAKKAAEPADEAPATETEVTEPDKAVATSEFGTYGPNQTKFIEFALAARTAYEDADNELQEGAALNQRNEKMCKMIGDGNVAGWQGKVITLDSNGDGYGIVELEIADDIKVATWNNFLSDMGDDTLIKPGPLYNKIIELKEGDIVSFTGRFRPTGDTCVNDSAMTKSGSTTSPDFIFKFSDINKVG